MKTNFCLRFGLKLETSAKLIVVIEKARLKINNMSGKLFKRLKSPSATLTSHQNVEIDDR